MSPAQFALIKLGLDALISIWAQHANKPPGWKPTADDWKALEDDVAAATPEAELELAKARLRIAQAATNP